jgi:ParB-like chromosome segregation protein Spo0J
MSLEVVYLSPQALTPYEGNTRKHNKEDIEQIKESILADGFNDPIGIWGEKNLIVEGHGRQIAAMELGLESVPCIRLDHLTDTQRRDYAIRHNRTAELSGWDFGKLEEEIARLEIEGVDLSGLKFDLDALNGGDNPETDKEVSLEEKYQLIVDCENENDMQEKYNVLREAGIECRVSTL